MPPAETGSTSRTRSIRVVFPTPGRPVIATRPLIATTVDSILDAMMSNGDLGAILRDEISRHPGCEPADLWKLVVQAVGGGDHLRGDPVRFAASLEAEWDGIAIDRADEPALQVIDPDGRTARVHLRPCKGRGVDLLGLTDLLVEQPRKPAVPGRLEALWSEAVVLAGRGAIPFDPVKLAAAAASGVPHHSSGYGFAAYRIVNDLRDPGTRAALRRLGIRQ